MGQIREDQEFDFNTFGFLEQGRFPVLRKVVFRQSSLLISAPSWWKSRRPFGTFTSSSYQYQGGTGYLGRICTYCEVSLLPAVKVAVG